MNKENSKLVEIVHAADQKLRTAALRKAAQRGRGNDDVIGHLTSAKDGHPGDLVIPSELRKGVFGKGFDALLKKHGLNVDRFTVGHKANKRNPHTDLPEFADGDGSGAGSDSSGGSGGSGESGGGEGGVGGEAGSGGTGAGPSGGTGIGDAGGGGGPGGGEVGTGHDAGPASGVGTGMGISGDTSTGGGQVASSTAAEQSQALGDPGSSTPGITTGDVSAAPAQAAQDKGFSIASMLGISPTTSMLGKALIGAVAPPAGLALTGIDVLGALAAHGIDTGTNPGGPTGDPGGGGPGHGGGAGDHPDAIIPGLDTTQQAPLALPPSLSTPPILAPPGPLVGPSMAGMTGMPQSSPEGEGGLSKNAFNKMWGVG